MKRFFSLLVLCLVSFPARAAMVRVVRVVDSRTLVLDGGAAVTLRGVAVPPEEEALAADYLRSLLANNAWVLVENGDVYRSPDALFVNGQLITRVYLTGPRMRYLGESMPGGTGRSGVSPAQRTAGVPPAERRRPRRRPGGGRQGAPRSTGTTKPGFVPQKGGV